MSIKQVLTLPILSLLLICSATAVAFAEESSQPTPSPTPRRALGKPVNGSRGFEQFGGRDASSRLIAAGATRGGIEASGPLANGLENYRAGKYEAAVRDLRQAVQQQPNSDDAHYALALALTEAKQLNEAIEEFKQVLALTIDPDLKIFSCYNMGNVYFDLGKYAEAIESYKAAIEIDPTLSKPHNNLGLAYAATSKINEAAAEFAEAVRLKPDYAEAHYNLGVAYLQLGKKKDAQNEQQMLMKLKSELAAKLDSFIK